MIRRFKENYFHTFDAYGDTIIGTNGMEFRLIVETSSSSENSITLEGRNWCLSEPFDISRKESIPHYVCISYRWGPVREWNEYIKAGHISDRTIPALETAIRSSTCKAFWTDVFCVPSEEPSRRATLESMGFIYSRASLVMVILSPLSFDVVKEMTERTLITESALDILEQDEWNRSVWTYQEVVNSRDLQFVCGSRTEITVDGNRFLNCVGSALQLYMTKHNLDMFTVYERFPNLSALEDIMLDSLIGGYTQRSALQILSNFHRRSYTEPRNYFYAMIGAIIQEPVSWSTGNTVSDIAEAFMTVCEKKNDYSFIYTSAPRAETPGKRWSPLPGILPAILPWHVIDLDGAQRGHHDSQGFWLDEIMTPEVNKSLGDAAKEKMFNSLSDLALAELSDSVIVERIYSALRRIGFTGSKDYFITEAGLFFPQKTLPEDSEVKFLVATGVRWAFGAPGLAYVNTAGSVSYVVGAFVGAVTKSDSHSVMMDGS